MKKYLVSFIALAMLAIMLPIGADAQSSTTRRIYRNGRWQTVRVYSKTNQGNHYGWRNRNRGITPQEQRRLARQRNRISTLQNRVTRDGVVTNREARKLNKRTNKYVRKVNKARNN